MRSHRGHPLIPTFEPSGLSLSFANKFDMMDHVLIGQLLSVSFMVPAGLTSVCVFLPFLQCLATTALMLNAYLKGVWFHQCQKFHEDVPDKKFPEMCTVWSILSNLFKFSIICLYHWDSHVLSPLSFVSFTLPPTVCPPDDAKGYGSS